MDYSHPITEGQKSLVAKGWSWHEQLRDCVPPGTDEKEIARRLQYQADLRSKGYVWNDRLMSLVPPGTTSSEVERQLIHRGELAKKVGSPSGTDLPDWVLIAFLLFFGFATFQSNPIAGLVVIGMAIAGWKLTYGRK